MLKRKRVTFRQGLTLMELVVVMAILVALAGLLVSLMPGLVSRASSAVGATNIEEIVKAIQLFAYQNNDMYADYSDATHGFDSSVNESGALCSFVKCSSGYLTVQEMGADASNLSRAGISYVAPMIEKPAASPGAWNPTFFPYGTDARVAPTMTALTSTTKAVYLDPAQALKKFGLPSDGRYVVFGLGKYSTVAGVGMEQPPVWMNPMNNCDPNSVYCRFGLVFQTAGAGGTALIQPVFVGAIAFSPVFGVVTQDDQLYQQEYCP